MLIAVGLAPEALTEVDATRTDWRERLGRGAVVVTDLVTARELSSDDACFPTES